MVLTRGKLTIEKDGRGKLAKPRKCPRSWKCQSLRREHRASSENRATRSRRSQLARLRSCRLRLWHVDPLTFRRSFDVYRINLPAYSLKFTNTRRHVYRRKLLRLLVRELMRQCRFTKGALRVRTKKNISRSRVKKIRILIQRYEDCRHIFYLRKLWNRREIHN